MAEAIVSVVLEQLVSVVDRQIQQEVKLVTGVDEEVKKLTSSFQSIQAVLLDAERKQITDAAVKVWLEKLKDVSYDMDDVLDEWNTAIMKRLQNEECHNARNLKSKVCSCFLYPYSSSRQVILRHDIAFKIKAITRSLDDIAKEKDMYNFQIITSSEQFQRVESTSLVDGSDIFGRDEEKNGLIGKLLNESSERQNSLHVISIVGMGGIGKTTLAQVANNTKEVISNFQKRVWVCVSNPFIDEWEIRKLIEGKKFLIVLDDVWTEDLKQWESFHYCLEYGLLESKVLVTTRKRTTALMIESIDIIRIDKVSDDQCWSIFRRFAFFDRTIEESQELEDIGRKIQANARACLSPQRH